MPVVLFNADGLNITTFLVRDNIFEAESRIKEIREKHKDPVYQALIDETVFWATRKTQLEAVFMGLKEEAARCKGAEEAARCKG